MKKRYNWGILGPGKIARKFTEGLMLLPDAKLYSVGSRSAERAESFAREYGFSKWYGSYQEFAADPELDVVYVASPHSHHHEHTMLCLSNGKHVICEKAFALNFKEVKAMVDMASEKKLFLMEALWPPFQPSYQYAHRELATGALGEINYMHSYFAYNFPYDPLHRLFNPHLGGGSLLDIGIYPIMDALAFMGNPIEIEASAGYAPTGVDHSIAILFNYGNGRYATLYSSVNTSGRTGTEIFCTRGKISLTRGEDKIQVCKIEADGKKPEVRKFMPDAQGYQFEAEELMRCLDEGRKSSSVVPHEFSLDLITLLDTVRKKINLVYPGNR